MKKVLLALAAVALLFATSCKKESINPAIDIPEGSFLATIDNGANPQNAPRINDGMGTMTTITTDRYVIWESDDKISINNSIYTTSTAGNSVIFSGGNATGTTFHAFYPASIAGTDNAGTLPATQTYEAGYVRNLPMYATSTNNQLTFHNICAALKITIPAFLNGATSIVVSSSDKAMNGAFTVQGDSAYMTKQTLDEADKKVTITKSGDAAFTTGEVVYIAVPAQTYGYFKVEFFNGTSSIWYKALTSRTLRVNKVYNINVSPMVPLCFTARGGDVTVSFSIMNITHQIETSVDDGNSWQNYTSGTGIQLSENGKVYFRATSNQSTATSFTMFGVLGSKFNFTGSGTVEASGNIMSLYGPSCPDLPLQQKAFFEMFKNCTTLTSAPELPASTLAENCYERMFQGCTALTSAPELPAKTLANGCYSEMFCNCTSLVNAPAIYAETLAQNCCYCMFQDCSSLTNAPALPAETLAINCYGYMFQRCTSLIIAPALPAKTLAEACYHEMFTDCTSLTSASVLSAETVAFNCCLDMFHGCTSLTSAPELYAETLADNCYQDMFTNCTSLVNAPAIHAVTLATACCYNMFYNCTSLTSAPVLYAGTLAVDCYNSMFYECSKLSSVTILATDVSAENCLYGWLNYAGTDQSVTSRNVHCKSSVQSAVQASLPIETYAWTAVGDQ